MQFKNISSKINTVQCDKISSNLNNGESNVPEDIFLIFYGKKSLGYGGVVSFKIQCESHSLIRKVSPKKCAVGSKKSTLLHKGFIASSKLCQNLCSLRWLKPTCNVVKSFIPFALCTLNMLFASGLIKLTRFFLIKAQLSALPIS